MGSSSMIASIILSSSAAMMKLLVISIVGIIAAKFPHNDPILPPASLKYISRLSNIVLLPCLIIKSLGGTINLALLSRIGILTFFCFIINTISYIICDIIGYRIHNGKVNGDRNSELYIAIKIAAGNGNAISLPILVMQILCQDNLINADFNYNSDQCYAEASSMIFVYMIVWFIMFWGYGFPTLQKLKQHEVLEQQEKIFLASSAIDGDDSNSDRNMDIRTDIGSILERGHPIDNDNSGLIKYVNHLKQLIHNPHYQQQFYMTMKKIIINPAILSVILALFIGLIPPIRNQFFSPDGSLSIIGASMDTIGEPVVALNTLIMAASLAQCDFPIDGIKKYFDNFLFQENDKYDTVPSISRKSESGKDRADVELADEQPYGGVIIEESMKTSNADHQEEEEASNKHIVAEKPVENAKTLPPMRSIVALIVSR